MCLRLRRLSSAATIPATRNPITKQVMNAKARDFQRIAELLFSGHKPLIDNKQRFSSATFCSLQLLQTIESRLRRVSLGKSIDDRESQPFKCDSAIEIADLLGCG